jgi:hypothetical protein
VVGIPRDPSCRQRPPKRFCLELTYMTYSHIEPEIRVGFRVPQQKSPRSRHGCSLCILDQGRTRSDHLPRLKREYLNVCMFVPSGRRQYSIFRCSHCERCFRRSIKLQIIYRREIWLKETPKE